MKNNECDQSDIAPVANSTENESKDVGQANNSSLEDRISQVLRRGDEDEKVVSGYGITLRRRDFWTLNNSEWLNDQVWNYFMYMCVYSLLYYRLSTFT